MDRYTAAVVSFDVGIPITKMRLSSDLLSFMMAIRGYCYGGIFISMRDPGRLMIWFQHINLIPYLKMIIETALNIYAKRLQIRFTNLAPIDFIYLIHMYVYYICIYMCACVCVCL